MSWSNVCVEAFCGGDTDSNSNYPCGRDCPSHLCLENSMCPLFAYAQTTEREVAQFPSLRLILKDRIAIWGDDLYWRLRWWFWDSLWFNRRKSQYFLDSIGSVSSQDYPELLEYENEQQQANEDFKKWFEVINEEETA